MVKASLLLYNLLSAKLSRSYDYYVDLLKDSISLMLFSIAQLNSISPPDEKDDTIQRTFDGLQTTLWKWIVHPDVIGGSVFGARILTNSKREEELKVIFSFYSLEYFDLTCNCFPTAVATHALSGKFTRSSSE